jgi:predicted transcriptional regulator
MATTTIRLDDDLKARLTVAAERAGKTAHAFTLDAVARTVEEAEQDEAFHRVADARWARLLGIGESVSWGDAKTWLEERARGACRDRPAGRVSKA